MKILMVNKFLYPKGGAETYFLKIGKILEEKGHSVQYFGMYDEKNTVGNALNLYTKKMDFHNSGFEKILYPLKIVYSLEAKNKIKKIIRNFKPDIVHLNNINFQLTPSIIDACYELNIPIIQTVHDNQMLCPNHLMYDYSNNKTCQKCMTGSKLNCLQNKCIHNSLMKSAIGTIEGILYKYKKTYSRINKIICPSYFIEKNLLTDSRFEKKTIVIHNFMDLSSKVPTTKKENYVLFFGRLSPEKGFENFIDACKKNTNINFKVVGSGPLEQLCDNIPNVEYIGFKFGKELDNIIANAKFTVYPSLCYENCPLSILESISLGTPVITIQHGGAMELVKNKETGLYILPENISELGDVIKSLYDNEKLLSQMYKKCINERNNMITLEKYYELLIELYKDTIGDKK